MKSYLNASGFQFVDSIGNRELTVSFADQDATLGIESDFYYDSTQGEIIYKIPSQGRCDKVEAPKFDWAQFIKATNDPESGVNKYL